ncbi:unnamed protein product [Ectocarpus sp. 12 AP-2014]
MEPTSSFVDLTDPCPGPTLAATTAAATATAPPTEEGYSSRQRERVIGSGVAIGGLQRENTAPESRNMASVCLQRPQPRYAAPAQAARALYDSTNSAGGRTGPQAAQQRPFPQARNPYAIPRRPAVAAAAAVVAARGVGAAVSSEPPLDSKCGRPGKDGDACDKLKKRKRSSTAGSSRGAPEADGERCSICLDPWTSKGKHRICTLLCGHLFGQSCIERWLKERRSCPQCGAKVGAKGTNRIIPLFLQNLVAQDTAELETTRTLLEEEKRLRKQCEAERVRVSIENASLKDRLSRLDQGGAGVVSSSVARSQGSVSIPGCPTPKRTLSQFATPGGAEPGVPSVAYSSSVDIGSSSFMTPCPKISHPGPAVAYSQFKTPPPRRPIGNLDVGAGGGSGGWGLAAAESGSEGAAAGSTVAVRFEQLLSRDVLSGRVAAFAGGAAGALVVSQELGIAGGSRGSLRHGVTKFSLADLRHNKSIHLHREQVRDVKFSADGGSVGYILSTSFDKTLKVCDLRTDSVVVQYELEGSGWSCQWSSTTPTQMFCGVVDGTRTSAVQLFDLRSTAGAVRKVRAAASQRQPIHSICHTADDLLFCATMGGVWAWGGGTKEGGGSEAWDREEQAAEKLQIQAGACCSLSQSHGTPAARSSDVDQQPFLVSTRGSAASHAVFRLAPASASSRQVAAAAGVRENPTAESHQDQEVAVEAQRDARGNVAMEEDSSEEKLECEHAVERQPSSFGFDSSVARLSAVVERRSWADRWTRSPCVAQGHQSQHTLSRSLLWDPSPGDGLLIAGGDERTKQPWMWDALTGDVCNRLASHRSPVLDFACLQDYSSGKGLLSAVSQSEIKVYQTCAR